MQRKDLRNLCIIAHVDHGKTTLVDSMLQQAGMFASHEKHQERAMDSQDLEREKGITISAKNTALTYKGIRYNIVDTPGHADFGGEVERILGSVDGAILLVDAVEGPLPQTRFVLSKALAKGLPIILLLNKLDRGELKGQPDRVHHVTDQVFDLFCELGASNTQADFPILYAAARSGWATADEAEIPKLLDGKPGNLASLFDLMQSYIPAPEVETEEPLRMQLSNLTWSDYLGQLAIGRVVSGKVKRGDEIVSLSHGENGINSRKFQVTKLLIFEALGNKEVEELSAGDIGIVAGCSDLSVGDTLAANAKVTPFPKLEIDPPTMRMAFTINNSPFAGKDGQAIQTRKLLERLERECLANIALSLEEGENEQYFLLGRGELQFAILIETMRRENLEFMVGRPAVLLKEIDGQLHEPIEIAVLDLPEEFSGEVTKLFQQRKGIMQTVESLGAGRVRLVFHIPTRSLIGIRSSYLTASKGQGLFSSRLKGYEPFKGKMNNRSTGSLIADRKGQSTDYALASLEERGTLFIGAKTEVYEGMIIGACKRENDMNVNPVKPKKLTNVRSTSSDGIIQLAPPKKMSLEQALEWLEDDEWLECTPSRIRLRKKILPANQRSVIRSIK